MSATLSDICAALTQFSPRIAKDAECLLEDADLLTSTLSCFEPNTLYVGKSCDIPASLYLPDSSAFLLIGRSKTGLSGKQSSVSVDAHSDMFGVFTAVKTFFAGKKRYERSSSELLESLIKGQGVGAIIETAASLVGNPAVLIDAGFRVLAHSRALEVNDPIWKKNIEAGFCTWEFITSVKQLDQVVKSPQSSDPFFVTCSASEVSRVASKIISGRNLEGFLIFFESKKNIIPDDMDIIRLASKVIAQELKKTTSAGKNKGAPFGYFFNDVIEQDLSDDSIRKRAKAAGIAKSRYTIICADASSFSHSHNDDYLRDTMESFFPGSVSAFYDDTVVLLHCDSKTTGVAAANGAELYAQSAGFRIGVSRSFSDIAFIRKAYQQAKDAATISKMLSLSSFVTFYESVLFYDMVSKIPSGYDLSDFCHPAVITLREYDMHNKTSYFQTLREYIASGCSINRAAKKLFIHRNTILYRVEKIEQLTGISPDDVSIRFLLESSFRLLEYQEHVK